jgi:hypothetical protein
MAGIPKLTAQLIHELCERIKAGAFDHVAAESLGVPAKRYRRWLARGRTRRAPALCRSLVVGVLQARGHARMMAELDMRTGNPKVWLLHGPGRERAGRPGWSAAPRPEGRAGGPNGNVLLDPVTLNLLRAIEEGLAGNPEGQAAIHQVLGNVTLPGRARRKRRPEKSA